MREAVLLWRRAGRPVDHTNIISRRIAPLCPWWRGTLDASGGDRKWSQYAANLQTRHEQVWEWAHSFAKTHMNYVHILIMEFWMYSHILGMSIHLAKCIRITQLSSHPQRSWHSERKIFFHLSTNFLFFSLEVMASGTSPSLLSPVGLFCTPPVIFNELISLFFLFFLPLLYFIQES